jgi:hypothetical protein
MLQQEDRERGNSEPDNQYSDRDHRHHRADLHYYDPLVGEEEEEEEVGGWLLSSSGCSRTPSLCCERFPRILLDVECT